MLAKLPFDYSFSLTIVTSVIPFVVSSFNSFGAPDLAVVAVRTKAVAIRPSRVRAVAAKIF